MTENSVTGEGVTGDGAADDLTGDAAAERTASGPARRHLPVWALVATAGGFGLFYAYALWSAVAFLVECVSQGVTGYGWFVLLLPIAFPVIVFAGVFAAGWRQRFLVFAFLLLAGLAIVAVFWFNVVGLVAGAPDSIFTES